MGEVVAVIKVLPKNLEQFEEMMKKVREIIPNIQKEEVEPIAFGLKAMNITVVVDDAEGGTEKIEGKLKEIENVGDVQVVGLARL